MHLKAITLKNRATQVKSSHGVKFLAVLHPGTSCDTVGLYRRAGLQTRSTEPKPRKTRFSKRPLPKALTRHEVIYALHRA